MPRDWAYIMKRFREGKKPLKNKDADSIANLCRIFHKLEVCEYAGHARYKTGKELKSVFFLRDKK